MGVGTARASPAWESEMLSLAGQQAPRAVRSLRSPRPDPTGVRPRRADPGAAGLAVTPQEPRAVRSISVERLPQRETLCGKKPAGAPAPKT